MSWTYVSEKSPRKWMNVNSIDDWVADPETARILATEPLRLKATPTGPMVTELKREHDLLYAMMALYPLGTTYGDAPEVEWPTDDPDIVF